MVKYILVTGGVISGIGKGVIASSVGLLLKSSGLRVTAIKIDPYLNVDAGTISPLDHGEVFVLDDGGETDLDLGNYERYLGVTLRRNNNITTGKVYAQVIEKERRGDYLGKTVQVIPHVTDLIQKWIVDVAQISIDDSNKCPDVCIIELGGIIGDIESSPFIEALRQLQFMIGPENFFLIHVSLIPVLGSSHEQKTKPTQASVRDLRSLGLIPDAICCRCTEPLQPHVKQKISLFCQVPISNVIDVHDSKSMYLVPMQLFDENLLNCIQAKLGLSFPDPEMPILHRWKRLGEIELSFDSSDLVPIRVGIVGKYTQLHDSFLSIEKALRHASIAWQRKLEIIWLESSDLEELNSEKGQKAHALLHSLHGIIVPGGFGERGTEGKIIACNYARINNIPFMGICLGLQMAVVEFCRNALGWSDANSAEFSSTTTHPVVILMPETSIDHLGGTMRLGARKTMLHGDSLFRKFHGGASEIYERHRHRYEVNPKYVAEIEASGMRFVGRDEKQERMECMQLDKHPFYIAVQYHPEYKSRPLDPAPIFIGFFQHAILNADKK